MFSVQKLIHLFIDLERMQRRFRFRSGEKNTKAGLANGGGGDGGRGGDPRSGRGKPQKHQEPRSSDLPVPLQHGSLEYIRHPGLRPRRISVLTRSGAATAFFDRNIRLLVDGQKANCTAWLLASLLLLFLHGVLLISWLRDALARRAGHGRHV